MVRNMPGRRCQRRRDDLQQSGFPRAVGPQYGITQPADDTIAHMLQDPISAKPPTSVFQYDFHALQRTLAVAHSFHYAAVGVANGIEYVVASLRRFVLRFNNVQCLCQGIVFNKEYTVTILE